MTDEHFGISHWDSSKGYRSWTPYGDIRMFEEGGHRAVELMLLSAAACLNFYLVEYVKARKLPVHDIKVRCDAEISKAPERVARLTTKVNIQGDISDKERSKMVHMCERACKVMNTFKSPPEIILHIDPD